jgi:hypothetical protein
MKKLRSLILAALAALALGAVASANAATLTITPGTHDVAVGNSFSADVVFDSLGAGGGLGAYDFSVIYDASRLNFQSATFGNGLDVLSLGSLQITTPTNAAVNFFEVSFDTTADLLALQRSAFTLVTLHFTTLAAGSASLGLTTNALADASGNSLAALTSGALISVSAVPEPESYAMLLAGLAIVGWAARRRRTAPGRV